MMKKMLVLVMISSVSFGHIFAGKENQKLNRKGAVHRRKSVAQFGDPEEARLRRNAMSRANAQTMGALLRQQQQIEELRAELREELRQAELRQAELREECALDQDSDVDMYPDRKKVVHFGENDFYTFDDTVEDVEARRSIEVDEDDFEDRD